MYIYTPLCRYWITLYRYVLVFIVPHVDIELEDNKQFISNIPHRQFMQIASNGDNLYEMSDLISGKNKKNITNLSSAELAQRVVKVNSNHPVERELNISI